MLKQAKNYISKWLLRSLGAFPKCALDQANHQLFKLMCASPAGGVPLGFMVLSGKDESLIAEGLEELKKLLPRKAFFKRFKRFTLWNKKGIQMPKKLYRLS